MCSARQCDGCNVTKQKELVSSPVILRGHHRVCGPSLTETLLCRAWLCAIQLCFIALFGKVGQRLQLFHYVYTNHWKTWSWDVHMKWFHICHSNVITCPGVTNITINAAWVLGKDGPEPSQVQGRVEVSRASGPQDQASDLSCSRIVFQDPGAVTGLSNEKLLFFDSALPSFSRYSGKPTVWQAMALEPPHGSNRCALSLTEPGIQLRQRKENHEEEGGYSI